MREISYSLQSTGREKKNQKEESFDLKTALGLVSLVGVKKLMFVFMRTLKVSCCAITSGYRNTRIHKPYTHMHAILVAHRQHTCSIYKRRDAYKYIHIIIVLEVDIHTHTNIYTVTCDFHLLQLPPLTKLHYFLSRKQTGQKTYGLTSDFKFSM